MLDADSPEQQALRELLAERSPVLLQIISNLMEANAVLRAEVAALKDRVSELESQNRPPAAPFRRPAEQKKSAPGRPGRKPGHPGACRTIPAQIDGTAEVSLILPGCCPQCGGAWSAPLPCVQYVEDLPPVRPRVLKITTWSAACTGCGCTAVSTHPQRSPPPAVVRACIWVPAPRRWRQRSNTAAV